MSPLEALAALADHAAFAATLGGPFRRAVRLHPRRGVPTGWGDLDAVPWCAAGRFHAADLDPASRLDYHTGLAWPQDAASQVPAVLLAARPGEVVVDCCAAPGSKSTQIGLDLGDEGLLVCADAVPARRRVLAECLARQGVVCALVTPMPLPALAEKLEGAADAVLVDAPCSGHRLVSSGQARASARRQRRLLDLALRLLRPGGRLVYSTCTPWRDEDEDVVAGLLADHADLRVDPVALPGCDADLDGLGGVRLWPQRQGTEPFFAIRLRRAGEGDRASIAGDLPSADAAAASLLPDLGLHVWRRGTTLFAGSVAVAACALPSEARGLRLGRLDGDRLDLDPWAVQELIARGLPATVVDHASACRLWAGEALPLGCADGTPLRTSAGAPLGMATGGPTATRLLLPSRLRRVVA